MCTQYCAVNKDETIQQFSTCVTGILQRSNYTATARLCEGLGTSGGTRVVTGFGAWLTVAMVVSGMLFVGL